MGRPVHFEVHASDVDRARRFYESVLGWSVQRWGDNPYWVITTGPEDQPGINGGLLPREGPAPHDEQPVNAFPLTVEVADLDATTSAAEAAGGRVITRRTPVPGVGWLAYVKDTEGNLLGVLQPDQDASASG